MTVPYSGIQLPQPGQNLQRMKRAWRVFTDQHGRRFGAVVDRGNNAPIGEFQPQGFIPPWLPTMRYAKWAEEGDLEFRWDYDAVAEDWSSQAASYYDEAVKLALQLPGDVPIPDVGGEVDRRIRAVLGVPPLSPAIPLACKAGDPWILGKPGAKDTLGLKAILEQGSGANGPEALRQINERLSRIAADVGTEFVPSAPEKVIAVERTRTINDRDETMDADVPPLDLSAVTYKEFLSAAMRTGMSMADAATAWKAHRENLALDGAA